MTGVMYGKASPCAEILEASHVYAIVTLVDADYVMPHRSDRSLSSLSLQELMAKYFFHNQRIKFLEEQLAMVRRFRIEGERKRKRKQNRHA